MTGVQTCALPICYQGTGNKKYLVFGEFWPSTSHSLHKMVPLTLRHSPRLHDFTAFRRRYRVESRPSSKARKNRKYEYKSMSSKKESKTCHVRRPSQRSLCASRENFYLLKQTITTNNFDILGSLWVVAGPYTMRRGYSYSEIYEFQARSRATQERRWSTCPC